ncbi:MAG: ABC transporter permease subunit [Oscillospiraceae bacterium]|nr:ABC transporter permease subunit [Oscillospiraceae bacterium]
MTGGVVRKITKPALRDNLVWARRNYGIYVMLLPAGAACFVFSYLPMAGLVVAFKDYNLFKGPFGSPWNGMANIQRIFTMPGIVQSIWNTLRVSVLTLLVGFPAPIIFALMLNELDIRWYKRVVQTISYMPYFLSWISVIGIVMNLYSVYGPINDLRLLLLGPDAKRVLFLSNPAFFIPNVLILTVWKGLGWDSIIYIAAITSIDPQLYEAAAMDGAGKLRQTWHITLTGILPTTMILLILRLGGLFGSNFELIYGLRNPFVNFEVISTIVFKMGIQQADFGLASAVGFMQGLVALALTFGSNKLSKMVSGAGVW